MQTIVKVDGKMLPYAEAKRILKKKFKHSPRPKTLLKKTY